jgi:hypothetical protein
LGAPFASSSEVIVLNAPSTDNDGTFLVERRGTMASGTRRKPRYAIEIRSQPLLYDLDEMQLGQGPAEAIRNLISDQIRLISQPVKRSTLRFRAKAKEAFARGESWAKKRYSGGRIGSMAPGAGSHMFGDSGRLAAGVFVRQNKTDRSYTVNLPVNRFNPEISGVATVLKWFADLQRLVPALDPNWLAQSKVVSDAIDKAVSDAIQTAESQLAIKIQRAKMMRLKLLKQALLAAAEVAAGD